MIISILRQPIYLISSRRRRRRRPLMPDIFRLIFSMLLIFIDILYAARKAQCAK